VIVEKACSRVLHWLKIAVRKQTLKLAVQRRSTRWGNVFPDGFGIFEIAVGIRMMKTLRIKAFGITRDILGGREVELSLNEGGTVGDLKEHLASVYPGVSQLKSLFIAVNNEYADDAVVLSDTDEVALIPPVSGG